MTIFYVGTNIPIPYKVYGLIDPRTHEVFYVGVTYHLPTRISNHRTCRWTWTYERCMAIAADGYEVNHCIFGEFVDEEAALMLEEALIISLPNVINRTNRKDRQLFWKKYPEVQFS